MINLSYLKGKTVLVTGGTGTFGNALISRLLEIRDIKKIIIFSRDELKQSQMQSRLKQHIGKLRFFIGDIRDLDRLNRAFEGVDIVVHAAALKQVPATEFNPFEAIRTNIIGSQNVIEAALNNNIKKTLLISSDKAVQPINLYGATKLCAERLFVAANVYAGEKRSTKFSVVRYGNVIGSRGSLVEIIKNQKEKGVIDLTDKEMTRFWIPIKKVIEVILNEVLNQMEGGEIFVPKMKSLKVVDVIKHLVPKCRINIIGIRPGEKLHETLITEYEAKRTVDLKNIFAIKPEFDLFKNEWLKNKLSVKGGFIYSSDNSKFILPLKKASELLGDEI